MNVLAILNKGFEELEATGTLVVLKRAGYNVDVVADYEDINGKHLLNYNNIRTFNEINPNNYDLLFIPGGGYKPTENTYNMIKYFYDNNKYIAAICSGPTYLGELGILKNRKYVCFPALNKDFGGTFVNDYVVYDNRIFTARSVASSILLPLKIVEVIDGKEKLKELKKQMEYLD